MEFNVQKKNIGENWIENLRENIREKLEIGVLVTDLNYYILYETNGLNQCNEVIKFWKISKGTSKYWSVGIVKKLPVNLGIKNS